MRFTARMGAALLLSLSLAGSVSASWQATNAGRVITYSPDGQTLLVGTQLRRASDGAVLITFKQNNGTANSPSLVNAVALSPDGQYAALGFDREFFNLDLYSAVSGARFFDKPIVAHHNGTNSVDFSPDRQLLASGGRDGTAKLWHLPDMKLVRTIEHGVGLPCYKCRVKAVAFSNDGQFLAVGGEAAVELFRVSDGARIQRKSVSRGTLSVAFSPDGRILAASNKTSGQYGECVDCSIRMWRVSDGALVKTIDTKPEGVLSIAFSPNQMQIAGGSHWGNYYGGVIRIWRVSDKVLLKSLGQSGTWPTSVAYSPDALFLAYGTRDLLTVVRGNPFSP